MSTIRELFSLLPYLWSSQPRQMTNSTGMSRINMYLCYPTEYNLRMLVVTTPDPADIVENQLIMATIKFNSQLEVLRSVIDSKYILPF